MLNLLGGRYLLYALLAIEVLALPYLLSPLAYSELEYYKNIVTLTPFLFFGVATGYVVSAVKHDKWLNKELYAAGAFLTIPILIIALLIGENFYLAISMFIFVIAMIVEVRNKSHSNFLVAMAYKPILAVWLIIISFLSSKYFKVDANATTLLVLGTVFALLTYLIISFFVLPKSKELKGQKFAFANLVLMFREGVMVNISTLLLAFVLFLDRHLIKEFFVEELPSYSFAFNVAQFVILGLTTFTYVNQVQLGKEFKKSREAFHAKIVGQLKKAAIFLLVSVVALIPIAYVVEAVYEYERFAEYCITIALFFGTAHVLMSVNSALVYLDKFYLVTLLLLVVLAFNLGVDYIASSPMQIILSSYFSLITSSLLVILIIFKKLSSEDSKVKFERNV